MPLNGKILKACRKDITTFIETGALKGEGVQAAVDAGFLKIFSIEFYEPRFNRCVARFKNNCNVSMLRGNSPDVLKDMLPGINERVLFWLDAHYGIKPETNNPIPLTETQPLLQELETIKAHPIKNHTILIDDVRIMNGKAANWHHISVEEVVSKLKEINPEYTITFIDSSVFSGDIIMAEIL